MLIIQYKTDLLGKVLEEKKLNLENQILYKIGYEYDLSGNQSCLKTYVNNKEQKKYLFYDELNRLIKTIDSLNNVETIEYNDFYENEFNQKVKQKISTNAIGQKTVITYDTIGRKVKIEQISSKKINDSILSLEEKFYDLNDNLRFQESTIYTSDRFFKKVIASWEYDNMNRLIKLIEAKNSKDKKVTNFTYSSIGLLLQTIKPDETVLENVYDELGNNIELKSSDGSIHYQFAYNELNQCILAKNLINNENIERTYDIIGNLLSEKKADILVISHEYDMLGNKIKTIYPDKSSAVYIYDPCKPNIYIKNKKIVLNNDEILQITTI